jgi:hypothetical protein
MKTYSGLECLQDVFAKFVNSENENGYVVDIGCQGPKHTNNSTLLLEMNWRGVGADINDYHHSWSNYENFKFYQIDTTIKKNVDDLFLDCPEIIDFLSIDVDGATLETLKNIDFEKYKFKCICVEHDYYVRGEELRLPIREIFDNIGYYDRVIQTVAEDWYVNYGLINDDNVKKLLKNIPEHSEIVGSNMINILNWLNIK